MATEDIEMEEMQDAGNKEEGPMSVSTQEQVGGGAAEEAYFTANEKILIFHGPLIYEAKILSVPPPTENEDGTISHTYLVHYSGWNKKWDEVVSQTRILKYNEENLRRQKEHKIAYESTLRGGKGRQDGKGLGGGRAGASISTTKNPASIGGESVSIGSGTGDNAEPSTSSAGDDQRVSGKNRSQSLSSTLLPPDAVMKKKKLEAHVETEIRFMNKQTVELPLPDRLKMILCDDFDRITRQKKLVKLPGRHTINNFSEVYKAHIAVHSTSRESQLLFVEGIKDFFNMLIGCQLLYPFERQQYGEFLAKVEESEERASSDEKVEPLTMTEFYGPIHLLRLFSKLGNSLAFTTMEEIPLTIFKNYCQDMFQYMVLNEADLFQPKRDYTISLPEYQRSNPPPSDD